MTSRGWPLLPDLPLLALAVALTLPSCGPAQGPVHFPRPPQAVVTRIALPQGQITVHYDFAMSQDEVSRAAHAVGQHWLQAQALAHPVSVHLGQVWPPRGDWHVYVHRRRSLGGPYAPDPVLGLVRTTGDVGAHVVLGEGELVPDVIHQLVHLFYAPRESHDFPAPLWADVLSVQGRSVQLLKLQRGVP